MGYSEPQAQPTALDTLATNPVGWSSMTPPQFASNASPFFNPMLELSDMTRNQKIGAALTGGSRGRPPLATDLPELTEAGDRFFDNAMAVAGATQPIGAFADALAAKYPGVKISITPDRQGGAVLDQLVVPKDARNTGVGTKIMEELAAFADQQNLRLGLSPSGTWGGSVPRLKEFYARFGFKPNTGRARDFTTKETMLRAPRGNP